MSWSAPTAPTGFATFARSTTANVSDFEYLLIIYGLLALVLIGFLILERSRLGAIFRMIGEDPMLTEMQGLNVTLYKILAVVMAGVVAGIGGALYAHLTTYVEPKIFNVMLGVHALAYGLIGGLGTAFGPLIGVALDIGLLESIRAISGYRMIVFGGLVAVLLIVRPRGLLDEAAVHWLRARWRGLRRADY